MISGILVTLLCKSSIGGQKCNCTNGKEGIPELEETSVFRHTQVNTNKSRVLTSKIWKNLCQDPTEVALELHRVITQNQSLISHTSSSHHNLRKF